MRFIVGLFLILHGLVHLLYAGQSRRLFELQPGLTWPDGSWAFSRLLGDEPTRVLTSILCILIATGFTAGGIGLLLKQIWWSPVVLVSALLSTLVYVLLWDGTIQKLPDKGGIALLINLAILAVLLGRWLDF